MSKKYTKTVNTSQPQVVLLHGLGRSSRSMRKLATHFSQAGYRVLNLDYPGISGDYPQIIEQLTPQIDQWWQADAPLHFVGHSFGGILIRGLLALNKQWQTGRCVMLGTPNQGTQTAKFMSSHWCYRHFVPRVTHQLIPDSQLLASIPEPEIETGVIAGNVNFHFAIPVSWYYHRATHGAPGDGVVELSNTRCGNMSDFLVLPLHHSFMPWDSQACQQALHFIAEGRFELNQI